MVNSISNCLIDYKKQRNNKQTVCHILVQHVIKYPLQQEQFLFMCTQIQVTVIKYGFVTTYKNI